MDKMIKEVPQELTEMFAKSNNLRDTIDRNIKIMSIKRLLKLNALYTELNQENWKKLYEIFPKLKGKEITFCVSEGVIEVKEKDGE